MVPEGVSISVVFALADRQEIVKLSVEQGTSVARAIELSGLARKYAHMTVQPMSCAIFSRVVELNEIVANGDRIEILRPLLIDPKENRRQVAARNKPKR